MFFGRRLTITVGALTLTLLGGTALLQPEIALADYRSDFIQSAVKPAQESQREWKVPASVTLAQAILESGWGRSKLNLAPNNNYFGIKCTSTKSPYQVGCVQMRTGEYYSGKYVTITDGFRTYASMTDSFKDHGRFLAVLTRYRKAFDYPTNPDQFVREVAKAGYATSPTYANSLIGIMQRYNLYQYDLKSGAQPAAPAKPATPATPATSAKPATPAAPAAPAKPAVPANQADQTGSGSVQVAPLPARPAEQVAPLAPGTKLDNSAKTGAKAPDANAPKPEKPAPEPAKTVAQAAAEPPKAPVAPEVAIPEALQDEEAAANRAEPLASPEQYVESVAASAQTASVQAGVKASTIMAAAIYHSSWGHSFEAMAGNNLTGLECTATPTKHQLGCLSVAKVTTIPGTASTTITWVKYRTYSNAQDALLDYVDNGGRGSEVPESVLTALVSKYRLQALDN